MFYSILVVYYLIVAYELSLFAFHLIFFLLFALELSLDLSKISEALFLELFQLLDSLTKLLFF